MEIMKYPQYCPECSGEHNNPRFIHSCELGDNLGSVGGYTCTDSFHNTRKDKKDK